MAEIRRQAEQNFNQPETAFRISHDNFLQLALKSPPDERDRIAKVSAFSDWVFDLENHPLGRSSNILGNLRREEGYRRLAALALGQNAEAEMVAKYIDEMKKEAAEQSVKKKAAQKIFMARHTENAYNKVGWKLIYNGTSAADMDAKVINSLTIDKAPLRAKPDLVLKDNASGDILIIELKTWRGGKVVPRFGWANVKVQLWCYSLIEWFEPPPKVYLQGHAWLTQNDELTGRFLPFAPWRSDDPRIQRESRQLFEAFGGRCGS